MSGMFSTLGPESMNAPSPTGGDLLKSALPSKVAGGSGNPSGGFGTLGPESMGSLSMPPPAKVPGGGGMPTGEFSVGGRDTMPPVSGSPGGSPAPSPTSTNPNLAGYAPTGTMRSRMGDLSAFMNPQTDNILNAALRNLDNQGSKARNRMGTEAFSSGAYGDARHGVESGMLDKELAESAGDLTADIQGGAFERAMGYLGNDVDRENNNFNAGMGWMGQDIDRSINTEFQNAQLDNQWFNNQLQAMGLGQSIHQNGLTNGMNYADALLGLDQYDRGINQDELNVKYDDWTTKRGWDADKLSQFLSFVQGTPSETSTTSSSPNNSWASLLGAALGNIQGSDGASIFG
jgi:hypothetical protein